MVFVEDMIRVKGLVVYGRYGVSDKEKCKPQKIVIDVEFMTSPIGAESVRPYCSAIVASAKEDDLSKTVNYDEACHLIKKYVEINSFSLIETLAERLSEYLLLTIPNLSGIRLTVHKPEAPMVLPIDTVNIQIERRWHVAYILLRMSDISNLNLAENNRDLLVENQSTIAIDMSKDEKNYFGVIACIRTILAPFTILERLKDYEPEVLFYDNAIIDYKDFHVPYIDILNSDSLIRAMCEIAPDYVHPVLHKTMKQLAISNNL